ncbi:hypothetical protein [Terrabacter carboxydivorans]|uniref:Uncharacterized protein n=1 Tax=Terrabacter carboxydivorans TaxID=619730 RepID=A0ABP5ZUK7_9MICO
MVTAMARPSTRALSVDAAVSGVLADAMGRARVHSVFRRVIALGTPAGQLLSLCGRDADDAPWSLRADVDDWTGWEVPTGAVADVDSDAIVLPGGARITLAGARLWHAVPAPVTADRAELTARADELAAAIRDLGVAGGAVPGPAPDPFAAAVAERVRTGLAGIMTGELAGRGEDVESAAAPPAGSRPRTHPSR